MSCCQTNSTYSYYMYIKTNPVHHWILHSIRTRADAIFLFRYKKKFEMLSYACISRIRTKVYGAVHGYGQFDNIVCSYFSSISFVDEWFRGKNGLPNRKLSHQFHVIEVVANSFQRWNIWIGRNSCSIMNFMCFWPIYAMFVLFIH